MEPVAALHEQGLIHYVGYFPKLEDEWTSFIPGIKGQKSPNRVDAEVYAFSELLLRKQGRKLGYSVR
jgi:phage terminase large subunit-like protein